MCACLSVSLILRPSEEEEEKESGTHCLRMCQVSLISCILFVSLRYMDSYVTCMSAHMTCTYTCTIVLT